MYQARYDCITCHRVSEPPEYPRDAHAIKYKPSRYRDYIWTSFESNMVGKVLEKNPIPEVIEWRDGHSLEYSVSMSKCSLHSYP